MRVEEFVRRVRALLDTAGVPYMLTGSLASSIHGIPRATNDVDFVIAPTKEQLLVLVGLCKRVGMYASVEEATSALQSRTQFNVIDFANGWKADLIVRKTREFSITEFDRRSEIEHETVSFMIASAEDVLIAKLEWAKIGESERQLSDAAGILETQGQALDVSYIEGWVDALDLQEQWRAVRGKVH